MDEKLRKMISKLIEEVEEKITQWDEEEEKYVCNYCNQINGIECMIVHKANCINFLIDEICEHLESETNKVQIEIPRHETVGGLREEYESWDEDSNWTPEEMEFGEKYKLESHYKYSRAIGFFAGFQKATVFKHKTVVANHHGKPEE